MWFTIMHRSGAMETAEDPTVIHDLLNELDSDDLEHTDVALSVADGWTLSAFSDGLAVLENLERGEPRHQRDVSRSAMFEMMAALASGHLQDLELLSWSPGYS